MGRYLARPRAAQESKAADFPCRLPNPAKVSKSAKDEYHELIRTLCTLRGGDWSLDESGARICDEWFNEIEPQLKRFGELEAMGHWASKIVGTVIRIAGIVQVIRDRLELKPSGIIEADSMQAAVEIGRYYLAHAKEAFSILAAGKGRESVTEDILYRICDWAYQQDERPSEITASAQYQRIRRTVSDKETIERALEELAELGWLRWVEPRSKRDSKHKYLLHPKIGVAQPRDLIKCDNR